MRLEDLPGFGSNMFGIYKVRGRHGKVYVYSVFGHYAVIVFKPGKLTVTERWHNLDPLAAQAVLFELTK